MKSDYYLSNTRKRIKDLGKFELITKDSIIEKLKKYFGIRIQCISIKGKAKKDISKSITGDDVDILETSSNNSYYFVYIKMVQDNKNQKYGFVGGRTSLHKEYWGDINFSDSKNFERQREKYMKDNNLEWYEDEIIIIKLHDCHCKREAIDIEHRINGHYENMEQNLLNLFD